MVIRFLVPLLAVFLLRLASAQADTGNAVGGNAVGANMVGTWEYRQANPGRKSGVDPEGERLQIERMADGQATLQYFGLERMGDEGVYYFAVQAVQLTFADKTKISFTVPRRNLYLRRPSSLLAASRMKDTGVNKIEMHFEGTLSGEDLVLNCQSEDSFSCPDKQLIFHRLRKSKQGHRRNVAPAAKISQTHS